MGIISVSFFGHRNISDPEEATILKEKIDSLVRGLFLTHEAVYILVGNDGDFDDIVASTIRSVQQDIDFRNSILHCVLPYNRADYEKKFEEYRKRYDMVTTCPKSASVFPKGAFRVRNQWMIIQSTLCVFYVKNMNGGAWQAMLYAQNEGRKILNLA